MKRTLREWNHSFHPSYEYQQLFYAMSRTLKYIHDNNYYVLTFNPNEILVDEEDHKFSIFYPNVTTFSENKVNEIRSNIYTLSYLQLFAYGNMLDNFNTKSKQQQEFLQNNFNEFTFLMLKEDVNYYQKVFLQNSSEYYYEYKNNQNAKKIMDLEKELEKHGGASSGKKPNLTKSTIAGRSMVSYEQPLPTDNKAGIAVTYILATIIIALSFVIPIASWIFALTK